MSYNEFIAIGSDLCTCEAFHAESIMRISIQDSRRPNISSVEAFG